ncbi:prolipoprotein diacylglyceryl transferase [Herbinix luporum]|jgi:phosphatidylglycerol:prolipoprotein diacylglycerol transferase|uniref:Phosphatidylglycerol--prolipoprotein diacylglyceryl transferase n=1 Tax=Herbinix luporum TaxID=1679721 RepID=A0A0K8J4T5_9FIRM|nr:prolipoprotein diacylglyceryl transferase [Herbinix luporum]MDI9489294.1 prolipoprotein diacylglyceryl transferase [Bacillota bacterium]CUH92359.1 putative membrane protein [Herbinix luporum]HHT58026.1 prolipoprotein diacylglyceryl transferase [Herbinix luporum]
MEVLLSSETLTNIRFPNLGIELKNLPTGINIFGFNVAFYGILIGLGMLCGLLITERMVKKTGQDMELYLDFALIAIIVSVIFTRLGYVLFSLDEFKDNPLEIFNLRSGGLMIYGGIFGAILTAVIFTRVRKYSFWLLADTGCIGLIAGQIIGRWGNFFNREAFGKYTDGLFAMQLNINDVSYDFRKPIIRLREQFGGKERAFERIMEIRNNTVLIDGAEYIQVHPTFLYESLWNLAILIFLLLYTKHKKFDGEIMLLYLAGYGLGRVWIEGLRTDQLFLWGTSIPISQLLSAMLVIVSLGLIIYKRKKLQKSTK